MQGSDGALSFTELVLNASFLVQLVMLFLLILSVVSWTIIIQRSNQYKLGRKKADEFEEKFWSGIDLNNLYQDYTVQHNIQFDFHRLTQHSLSQFHFSIYQTLKKYSPKKNLFY